MEPQNISEKPTKSKIWVIGTIWANIIIFGLILVLVLQILNLFLHQFLNTIFGQILLYLIGIGTFVYAIKIGIKSVLKKTFISKEDVIGISFGVVLIPIILQVAVTGLGLIYLEKGPSTIRIFEFIIADIGFFFVTYFWCKKLIK